MQPDHGAATVYDAAAAGDASSDIVYSRFCSGRPPRSPRRRHVNFRSVYVHRSGIVPGGHRDRAPTYGPQCLFDHHRVVVTAGRVGPECRPATGVRPRVGQQLTVILRGERSRPVQVIAVVGKKRHRASCANN